MNRKHSYFLTAVLAGIMLVIFSGCAKRYWYRNKFSFFGIHKPRTTSIHLTIINNSKHHIPSRFEESTREFCLKRLEKKGYVLTKKDTPDLNMLIYLRVDSFHTHYNKAVLMGYTLNRQPVYNHFEIHRDGMQLLLEYRITAARDNSRFWDSKDQLFYFNQLERDLRRSKSVMKYDLNQLPETE